MRRRIRVKRSGMAALASASLLAVPITAACSPGPTYEDWAATDGAAGRINLDEVQRAFKDSKGTSDFEVRVNKIYEGDGIVLIRAKQDGETLTLEGWEDLSNNKEIDQNDDLLFSIIRDHGQHELRGHGANGYYRRGFGGGDFLFTYMMISALSPGGYYYSTPYRHANSIQTGRANYRSSSAYRTQVSRNSNYFSKQKSFAGSNYNQSARNTSTSRNSYLNSQKASGAFKSSGTGVRSSWGSRSTGKGGFRGGGGGITIINFVRSIQQ